MAATSAGYGRPVVEFATLADRLHNQNELEVHARQDNGLIWGGIQADQSISFQLMKNKLMQFVEIIRQDPAVAKVAGFYGGGSKGSVGDADDSRG